MGHLGLTPQSVNAIGGHRVQGRTEEDARRLLDHADALSKAGAFAIVLEALPADVARRVTEIVPVPTIGIGAGPGCDGQVLVINDLLGLGPRPLPKFAKAYANLRGEIERSARDFAADVREGRFPDAAHSYE